MTIHDHTNELAHVHRLGDGRHTLPVKRIKMLDGPEPGLEPVDSRDCILLLFVCWAQRLNYDAIEIYHEAYPREPGLRPDLLLSARPWVEIPPTIDTDLLCRDLAAIDRSHLVEVIMRVQRVGTGHWRPPPAFTHWVMTSDGRIAGEARDLDPPGEPDDQGQHFCYVRLFAMPEMAEWGYSNAANLVVKRGL